MAATHILGISGSLRRDSYNTAMLRSAQSQTPDGVELELFTDLADVPLYNEDLDGEATPAGARRLREAVARADALLIATPEYNGTIPGVLKNALDWASRPYPNNVLKGKPALVVGASTSLFGAVWAQADVRKALGVAGAKALEHELGVGQAQTVITPEGEIGDEAVQERLSELVAALAEKAGAKSAEMQAA